MERRTTPDDRKPHRKDTGESWRAPESLLATKKGKRKKERAERERMKMGEEEEERNLKDQIAWARA